MLQNTKKIVENMCIFIKFSLKNGTEPLKKRDSNIFDVKSGTEPPK